MNLLPGAVAAVPNDPYIKPALKACVQYHIYCGFLAGLPEGFGEGGLVHRRGRLHSLVHGGPQSRSLLCGAAGLPWGCPLACPSQDLGCLELLHHLRK